METLSPKVNKTQVWSCGGGTQSCAIAALIVDGLIEKPDYSVIADTGREVSHTWQYVNQVLKPELKRVGVDLVEIRASEFATVDLFSGADKDTVVIPAHSDINGTISKLPNYCTNEWKTRVIDRYLRKHGVTDYIKWIGFSIDETPRIIRMQRSQPDTRFPLVERRLKRRECIELVKSKGWPEPPRSRCWMCPNQGDHEWRQLKNEYPEDFAKAVELEKEIQKMDPHVWLHKSCIPLDQVDFSQPEDLFSRPCDSGMCFV